ncbi:MAG: hypothetical protein HDR97_04885 [Bacteroides sp.]|nr:hypothetical protein [Bacteroides sp.]
MSEVSIRQFEEFYTKIKGEYDDKKASSELNSDRMHNAAIMKLMLESSRDIFMFCGSLSIFRPEFYQHIAGKYDSETADYVKVRIAKALSDFLSDEKRHLNVILEKDVKDLESSMILDCETVRSAINRGTLSLKSLNSKFLWGNMLSHFAYSNDSEMLRIEEDKIEHAGLFVTKDKRLLKYANSTYDKLNARSGVVA